MMMKMTLRVQAQQEQDRRRRRLKTATESCQLIIDESRRGVDDAEYLKDDDGDDAGDDGGEQKYDDPGDRFNSASNQALISDPNMVSSIDQKIIIIDKDGFEDDVLSMQMTLSSRRRTEHYAGRSNQRVGLARVRRCILR